MDQQSDRAYLKSLLRCLYEYTVNREFDFDTFIEAFAYAFGQFSCLPIQERDPYEVGAHQIQALQDLGMYTFEPSARQRRAEEVLNDPKTALDELRAKSRQRMMPDDVYAWFVASARKYFPECSAPSSVQANQIWQKAGESEEAICDAIVIAYNRKTPEVPIMNLGAFISALFDRSTLAQLNIEAGAILERRDRHAAAKAPDETIYPNVPF